jgi:hypothetical protein
MMELMVVTPDNFALRVTRATDVSLPDVQARMRAALRGIPHGDIGR